MIHTGQLGDVMQESIQAAMTVIRSRAAALGIESGVLQNTISMCMYLKVLHLRMVQVLVLACVLHWFHR